MDELSPTQRRIAELLADGRPHTRAELHALLPRDGGPLSNVQPHLTALRKRLRPLGEEVVCEIVSRRICYRRVRLISSPHAGT